MSAPQKVDTGSSPDVSELNRVFDECSSEARGEGVPIRTRAKTRGKLVARMRNFFGGNQNYCTIEIVEIGRVTRERIAYIDSSGKEIPERTTNRYLDTTFMGKPQGINDPEIIQRSIESVIMVESIVRVDFHEPLGSNPTSMNPIPKENDPLRYIIGGTIAVTLICTGFHRQIIDVLKNAPSLPRNENTSVSIAEYQTSELDTTSQLIPDKGEVSANERKEKD